MSADRTLTIRSRESKRKREWEIFKCCYNLPNGVIRKSTLASLRGPFIFLLWWALSTYWKMLFNCPVSRIWPGLQFGPESWPVANSRVAKSASDCVWHEQVVPAPNGPRSPTQSIFKNISCLLLSNWLGHSTAVMRKGKCETGTAWRQPYKTFRRAAAGDRVQLTGNCVWIWM